MRFDLVHSIHIAPPIPYATGIRDIALKLEITSVMVRSQCLLTGLSQQILSESSARHSIVIEHNTSLPQLGDQKLNNVLE